MKLPDIDIEDHDAPPLLTDEVVDLIISIAKESSNKLLSKVTARKIYEAVIQTAITETIRTGQFRLPQGWGQFMLKLMPARRGKAFGREIDIKSRGYVRYREGNAVKAMLDREGHVNHKRKRPRPLGSTIA